MRASDDYGLSRVRLEMQLQQPASPEGTPPGETQAKPVLLKEWTEIPGQTAGAWEHTLKLEPGQFTAGQVLLVRAVAADKRLVRDWGLDLRPQETATPWHEIRVADPREEKQQQSAELANLRVDIPNPRKAASC